MIEQVKGILKFDYPLHLSSILSYPNIAIEIIAIEQ